MPMGRQNNPHICLILSVATTPRARLSPASAGPGNQTANTGVIITMDQTDVLSRAWELTQAIQHAATRGDWITAARLAEERSPLLMSLAASQTPDAMVTIRRIQEANSAIMADAQTTQRELQTEFRAALRCAGAYIE